MRRLMMGFAVALIAAFVIPLAVAQSVAASLAVSWIAPVNDINGLPLAGSPNAVTSYQVYASTSVLTAVPASALATVTAPTTTVSGTFTAAVGQTIYVYVTACNATGCSGLSAPGTKVVTIPSADPGVPTVVTLTVTIT
jgi:hypothetical protein